MTNRLNLDNSIKNSNLEPGINRPLNHPPLNPMNPMEKPFIKPFHHMRYLYLNDPQSKTALDLRFSRLSSGNGFKRIAENWGIFYHRTDSHDVKKTALKQSYDLAHFHEIDSEIRLGDCFITRDKTQGLIHSKGNSLSWDLSLKRTRDSLFNPVPEFLSRTGLIKNEILTLSEHLWVSGRAEINGESFVWKDVPATEGYRRGSSQDRSWVWGHCNVFKDEKGEFADFVFEGLCSGLKLGPLAGPRISSFYFEYQGRPYFFNTMRVLFQIKSKNTFTDWQFEAGTQDIAFRGHVRAEHKDFAGLTYEDTDGSLLYSSSSKLSSMRVLIYRGGKLEATLDSDGTTSFEVVSREKNPYVPLIV